MKYIKSKSDFIRENKSYQLNEGQFSWMTHDTNDQIGSEKQNTIDVYMYDNEGNKWKETRYDGYGNFGGMDYYDLVATMNGYDADRQKGIDLAFGKLKTKDKKRKTLFPALVTDPRYNWKRHDFTQEAEGDPNQSWYQEEEEYDDYYESVLGEGKEIEKNIKDIEDGDVIVMGRNKHFKVDYIDPWSAGGRILVGKDVKTGKKGKMKVKFLTPRGKSGLADDTMLMVISEKRSTPYGEIMLDLDAAMKKAIKKGVTTLSYAKDYVQSLERMAKKNAKRFFKDYQDFTEDDWIEDVRYNMANEKVNEKFKEGEFIKSKVDSDRFNGDVYDVTNDVDGTEIDKGMTFRVGSVGRDEAIIFGADDEIEYSIDPNDLKKYFVKESVNEAKYKVGDNVTVTLKGGKEVHKGKVEKINPLKIRTSPSDVMVLGNHLIQSVVKESVINEGRAAADRLLKDVVKGNTNSVEGVKMSKEMAEAFLDWLKMSTYGKKFGKLPFDKLFTASFNWGLDRYIKGYNVKDEFKELKAKAKEMKESLTEGKGDKAVSMAQKKLDKVMADLKANLLKFKGAKTDADKETFKTEAGRLTQLRKDAHNNLEQAIQDAYADVDLVVMENYDTEQRKEMAAKGLALPDGSFPIKNLEDLKNAIQAYGRAKDQAKAAKFIAKRAKALGADDLIPDTEDFQKALKEAEFGRIPKFGK
jgi:hypothetical protein